MVDMEERVARAMAATRSDIRGEAGGCVEGTKEAVAESGTNLIEDVIRKMMDRPLVGIAAIAKFAGVKQQLVNSWIDDGLPIYASHNNGGRYVTTEWTVMDWLRRNSIKITRRTGQKQSSTHTEKEWEPLQKAVGQS